jgi:hypothetical protein
MKYLFTPICAIHMYAVSYELYNHPSISPIGLHNIGCRYKFMKHLRIFKLSFGQVDSDEYI